MLGFTFGWLRLELGLRLRIELRLLLRLGLMLRHRLMLRLGLTRGHMHGTCIGFGLAQHHVQYFSAENVMRHVMLSLACPSHGRRL